jgi:DNA-binding NtrC family response regulator
MRYAWPGNVRELRNAMERAVIVASGELITPENLPPAVRGGPSGNDPVVLAGMTVDEVERRLIFLTLEKTEGNKTRAAKMLGVSLKTLHNKLRRYREEGLLGAEGAPAEAPPIAEESSPVPEDEG